MIKKIHGLGIMVLAFSVVLGFPWGGAGQAQAPLAKVQEELRRRVEAGLKVTPEEKVLHTPGVVRRFYKDRSFQPAWLGVRGLLPQAASLLQAVEKAGLEGLRPEDYHFSALRSLLREGGLGKSPGPEKLADLDLLLTDSFLTFASHLISGRIDPETVKIQWPDRSESADLAAMLEETLASKQIEEVFPKLLPRQPAYGGLRQALAAYRQIDRDEGWPQVPPGPKLRKGSGGDRVLSLRKRLAVSGDLGKGEMESPFFDASLEHAVRRFQKRHGLDDDGIVGPATLRALNVPVEERVREIEANMEQWRWLRHDLGERYILVNIANFQLQVMEKDQPVLEMKVVVGRRYTRTPVFSAPMSYLVFRPYWNVTPNIARREMLPQIKKDLDYLQKNQLKVVQGDWGSKSRELDPGSIDWSKLSPANFPYRLRQDPGPKNSLGLVKFVFPNQYNVYLHDTPARELFKKPEREFSHGCIRIEKPLELAKYVLRGDPKWSEEKIIAAMQRGADNRKVTLPDPIMVYAVYLTVWVEKEGTVQFWKDIYRRTGAVVEALKKEVPKGL